MGNSTNKGDCSWCSAFQVFPTNTFSSNFACLSDLSIVEVDFFQGSKLKERENVCRPTVVQQSVEVNCSSLLPENARALHMNIEKCRKIVQPDDMTVRHLRRPRMNTKIVSEIITSQSFLEAHGSRLKFK